MSTRTERETIYYTRRWKLLRDQVKHEAGNLCERCKESGRTSAAEIVHHRRPLRAGGDPWARSNCEAVCRQCHADIHRAEVESIPVEVRAWRRLIAEILKRNEEVLT